MSTDISQTGKDSPVIVGNNPEDSQTSQQNVPRSALGTVSESGEILDDGGKTVGKVSESTQELVGNTVNTTGEVVSSTGEVLGKAIIGDNDDEDDTDYTTKPKQEEVSGDSSNFSLVDNTKGVVSSGLGLVGGNKQGNDEKQEPLEGEKSQTKSETQFPLDEQDHDTPDDAQDAETPTEKLKDTANDAQKQVPADKPEVSDKQAVPEEVEDAQQDAEEVKDDLKEAPPQAEGEDLPNDKDLPKDAPDAKDTVEDGTEKVEEAGEEVKDVAEDTKETAKDSAEDTKDTAEDTVANPNDTAEDAVADTKETAEDAADDTKDTAEDAKDNLVDNAEVPKNDAPVDKDLPDGDKVPDEEDAEDKLPGDDKAGDDQGDDEKKPEGALTDGQEVVEGTTDEAQDATADVKEGAEDATADVKDGAEDELVEGQEVAEDKAAEGEEAAKDTTVEGEQALEDKAEDAQDKVDETAEETGEQVEDAADKLDFTILKGTKVNKAGNLVNDDGDVQGRVIEGDVKKIVGKRADENGDIWDDGGKKVGRAEPLSAQELEATNAKTFAPFENFPDSIVESDGKVVSEGRQVGVVVEGDARRLKGSKVDEDGDILDRRGNVVGKAEAWDEPDPIPEAEPEPVDVSILKGTKVNKSGNLVDQNGNIIGRVIEGDPAKLLGKRSDENGDIWDDGGKKIGKAEPLPDSERENIKAYAPFENFPDAIVEADGKVTSDGRQIGVVVEGDPKKLKGSKVDEDGDILDRRGNAVGKAEAWDEPEPTPEEPEAPIDRSALAGKRVNKSGNVVDGNGVIFGRIIEGNLKSMIGRMADKEGNIRSEAGDIIGKAELVPEGEREGSKEGPFAELDGLTVTKDGKVVTPGGEVVGRLISGDARKLSGRKVDSDGDVLDGNGNSIGKAERWEEPEVEKKKDPLSGRKINKEGNVVDEDGNVIGKLVTGDLAICSGKEVDDDGDVINSKGHTIGHVSRLEDIPEPQGETEEEKKLREEKEKAEAEAAAAKEKSDEEKAKVDAEKEKDRKLAAQLGYVVQEALDKVKPLTSRIIEKIDAAEAQKEEDRDEEELVRQVRPLIEDAGKILTETNGAIRGMDPDGRIQRQAKQKAASRDATPEEHHLAEVLKDLTGNVTTTIDNAKRKIAGMPHAKKELNPLWGLLSEPLFQILAAVGLLLNGVLGLVGRLLSGLGLGGILDGLLGGLGLDKILEGLGLGQVVGSLTGGKKKEGKKGGGLLGGIL